MSAQEKAQFPTTGLNKNINYYRNDYSTKNVVNFVHTASEIFRDFVCGFPSYRLCGFPPSVFRRDNGETTNSQAGLVCFGFGQKARLFLLSKEEYNDNKIDNKLGVFNSKRTKNRKYVTKSPTLKHNNIEYEINSAKSGVFTSILHKFIEQLEICETKWNRVFVLRFDLHRHYHTQNNKSVSRFIDNLKRRLQRAYDISEIGYLWVREQEKSKSQHYHFALLLDGNKIRHSSKILKIIESTWKAIEAKNHVPTIKNPFYFIDNEDVKADAIYRVSYLAKARGKGYRDKQVKDYSTSRLTCKLVIDSNMEVKL